MVPACGGGGGAGGDVPPWRVLEEGDGALINEEEAVLWYRRAAEARFTESIFTMGVCWERGVGVPVNKVEALSWYRRAGEAGLPKAMFNVGMYHCAGRGRVCVQGSCRDFGETRRKTWRFWIESREFPGGESVRGRAHRGIRGVAQKGGAEHGPGPGCRKLTHFSN